MAIPASVPRRGHCDELGVLRCVAGHEETGDVRHLTGPRIHGAPLGEKAAEPLGEGAPLPLAGNDE